MSKTSKLILGILLLMFISVFVKFTHQSFYDDFFLSPTCWAKKETKGSQFYGKVRKKYIDSSNHSCNTITVENNNHFTYVVVFPDNEELALYDTIEINDSIRKDANSLRFYIKRYNSNKTDTILVKYNCK